MDPLSISASIAGLLALTGTVIRYLSSIEEASEERGRLLLEVSSASGLLYSLKEICEQTEPSSGCFMSLESLCAPQGPFEHLKKVLELLAGRLAPRKGLVRAKRALTWFFDKREIDDLMKVVERQKTYFLLALQGNNVKLSQHLAQSITAVDQRIERIEDGIRDLGIDQDRQVSERKRRDDLDVLTWLSPTTFASRQRNVLLQAQPGTGQWIFKEDAFVDWLASPLSSQTLWLPGIPGSGKTTLASIIIDTLERDLVGQSEVGIVYVFCDYKDSTQTSDKFKRVILRELLHQLDEMPKEIEELYQNHFKESTEPSATELDKALHLISSRFLRLFYIVDALDELSEADGVVESLLKLSKNLHPNIKSLFTSRWTARLNNEIQREAQIEVFARDQDIHAYLSHEINSRSRLQHFIRKESEFKDQIINTVLENCEGMFLVARLHIESLGTKLHLRAAKLALQQLPNSLDGVYENALDRIRKQEEEHVALAWKVLSWTVCTVRPLSSEELQHALAVEDDSDELDADALIDVDLILSVCAGLVVLDPQDSAVLLVHYTAEEFFKRRESKLLAEANHEIARVCIQYMSFRETLKLSKSSNERFEKMDNFPLLKYAALHWGTHFVKCENNSEVDLKKMVESFLNDDARCLAAYQMMCLPRYDSSGVNGLHISCYFGLTGMIEKLLEKYGPTSQDPDLRTPLHWAATGNQPLAAKLLLKNGAGVDIGDCLDRTALHVASICGHLYVALILVEYGCDIEQPDTFDEAPLILALRMMAEDVALFLINQGADFHVRSFGGETPLHLAACHGKLEHCARLLLQKGAKLDVLEHYRRSTPLMVAAQYSNVAVMHCLLGAGAEKDLTDRRGYTALHYAVDAQADGPLSLLLEYGADPNLTDIDGKTSLYVAIENGYLTCISILLSVTNLDSVDVQGRTVLHATVKSKDNALEEVVMEILNTQKVDIDATDDKGWTALNYAKNLNLPNIEQLLLNAGAKPALLIQMPP